MVQLFACAGIGPTVLNQDPSKMFDTYGADAVRLFMCKSPVVRAEPLKFKEKGCEARLNNSLFKH